MNRESWVDYAKAIGIILVVYGHVARGVVNAGVEVSESTYLLIDSILYSFHMPLFFFLSGLFFVSSFQKRGSVRFVFSKIDTIVYPYILWSLLQGVIEVYLSNYTNGNVSFSEVLSLLWSPRAHFWFLYALFYIFLATVVIYLVPLPRRELVILALSVVLYLVPGLLPDIIAINYLIQYLVFFCLGIFFTRYASVGVLARPISLLVAFGLFVAAQCWFHVVLNKNYSEKGWETLVLASVSITFVVCLSLQCVRFSSSALRYIGVSSMAIYLMHVLAGSGVRVILDKFLGVHSFYIHAFAGCIVGILGPIIAFWLIKKWNIPFVFSAPISRVLPNTPSKSLSSN